MGSYWVKHILFELKRNRGIIFHETEERYKIWGGIDLSFHNWHKQSDKFWPEYSKISKVFLVMDSFWAIVSAKKSIEELSFMKLKKNAKFAEKLTCCLKIGIRNLRKFDPCTWSLKSFHFNGLLLSKVYILWAKKVQRNNLSWNWREIQNLERNQLAASNLA